MRKHFLLYGSFTFILLVALVIWILMDNKPEDIVLKEEVIVQILEVNKVDDSNALLTIEVTNENPRLAIEKNHIFISDAPNSDQNQDDNTIVNGQTISSSITENAGDQEYTGVDYITIEGDFSSIDPNQSAIIETNVEFNDDRIVIIFRSDQIRFENNGTRTHFTTIDKGIDFNDWEE